VLLMLAQRLFGVVENLTALGICDDLLVLVILTVNDPYLFHPLTRFSELVISLNLFHDWSVLTLFFHLNLELFAQANGFLNVYGNVAK